MYNDRFNYWLDGPIDLHCRIGGLFESIDRPFDIAALLLSFRLFARHFCLQSFVVLAQRGFPDVSSPFFAFFPARAKQLGNCKLVELTKCLQLETNLEWPLANGCLLMNKIAPFDFS